MIIHTYLCIYIYTYIHKYIYIHIHTYVPKFSRVRRGLFRKQDILFFSQRICKSVANMWFFAHPDDLRGCVWQLQQARKTRIQSATPCHCKTSFLCFPRQKSTRNQMILNHGDLFFGMAMSLKFHHPKKDSMRAGPICSKPSILPCARFCSLFCGKLPFVWL